MTHTAIITADGTTFHEAGRGKRLIIRALIIAFLLIIGLITTAAVIGFSRGPISNSPSTANFAQLHRAELAMPKGNCRLEWNSTQNDHEVICDGNSTYDSALRDIRALAARKAISHTNPDGSVISDPNGIALLQECLSDNSLSLSELHSCITQPGN